MDRGAWSIDARSKEIQVELVCVDHWPLADEITVNAPSQDDSAATKKQIEENRGA